MIPWIVGILGAALVRLLGVTWRVREVGTTHAATRRGAAGGVLFALWHEHMLPLIFIRRGRGVTLLISQHRDGELITRVVKRLGFRVVRGSTSRGGFRALIELARLGQAGGELAITPDGPRGPRRAAQIGGLIIAQRSGIALIPASLAAHPVKRLASWDRFMIPWPFARIVVGYGEALRVPAGIKAETLEREWVPRLNRAMEELSGRLERELTDWTGHETERAQ